jgi:hypothetical protein
MNSSSFDLSTVVDPVIDSIRLRLPELITAEVKRQLSESPVTKQRLSDTEHRQRNALRAQAGLPLLPGVGMPAGSIEATQQKVKARIAAIRARKQ